MKKNKFLSIVTIGFALFAMFFGAGNLLLPPLIGLQTGSQFFIALIAFGLSGILLPLLGILSVIVSGENFNDLGNRIHKWIAPVLGSVIMICVGPLIAVPRTAATTFEISIQPFFPDVGVFWSSLIFFIITLVLCIRPTKIVDIIGNYLTPFLLVFLIFLIGAGVFFPTDVLKVSELSMLESFSKGFLEGYQTLDVLVSVIFAGLIVSDVKAKGYIEKEAKFGVAVSSGVLSSVCLLVVYGGLIYLGATSGIDDEGIKRSDLLITIASNLFGSYGVVAIAFCMAFACITTSISITSSFGSFFSNLFSNKISYVLLVILCCIVSFVLSVKGVDEIISFAYPILAFVYPIVITLVLYVVVFGSFIKNRKPYLYAMAMAMVIGFLGMLRILNLLSEDVLLVLRYIPLFEKDLGWILPSLLGFLLGYWVDKK